MSVANNDDVPTVEEEVGRLSGILEKLIAMHPPAELAMGYFLYSVIKRSDREYFSKVAMAGLDGAGVDEMLRRSLALELHEKNGRRAS